MKTIKKLGLVLCSALVFVACDTVSDDWKPGSWDAAEGFEDVSFVGKTSVTDELDPTDPKTATVTMKRKNTKGELVVTPEVTVNDDSVFTVTDFHFADGDSLATATISFPKAKIGTSYSLQLTVTDKNLVSSYSDGVLFNYSVTCVKWVSLGKGTYIDNVIPSVITNPVITNLQSEPEFFIRDDDHTRFRVKSPLATATFRYQDKTFPYVGGLLSPEEAKGISEWFTFRVLQKGDEYGPVKDIQSEDLVAFERYYTGADFGDDGELSYLHPSAFKSLANEDEWKDSKVISWQAAPTSVDTEFEAGEKIPAEINLGALAYLSNYGVVSLDRFPLVFYLPGYKPAHKADLKSEDFEWKEVYTGTFISEQLGTESKKTLYKGTCVNKTDDCDSTFAAQYGTAYTIQSPYAEDYNLIFTVKDGNIMVPDDEELQLQEIGVEAMGEKVFAKINIGKSKYTEEEITLNITFTDKTGEKDFGTANEVMTKAVYSKVGTADWTYTILFANEDGSPYVDADLELQKREDIPNHYRILHALNDVTIMFSIDADNIVRIPQQLTGATTNGMPIFVGDVPTLMGEKYRPNFPSVYDPETKTITTNLFYNLGDGNGMKPGVETIKLNFDEAAAVKKAAKRHPNTSVLRSVKKRFNVAFPWTCYTVKSKAKASHLKAVKTSAAPQFFLGE